MVPIYKQCWGPQCCIADIFYFKRMTFLKAQILLLKIEMFTFTQINIHAISSNFIYPLII